MILLLIIATIACQQRSTKEEPTTISGIYSKEDSALVNTAKMFFKIIPEQANQSENQVTDAKVKLGQVLFYDTRLSKTGNNSCNSCHNLSTYGVDNVSTSKGDAGQTGERNSPTVFNASLHNMQFWDGRAATIEEQAGMPILNPVEMAIPHKGFLVTKLHKDTVYHKLFTSAFPGEPEPVSFANVRNAIGAFERTLLTPSRFDKFMGGDLTALNPDEKALDMVLKGLVRNNLKFGARYCPCRVKSGDKEKDKEIKTVENLKRVLNDIKKTYNDEGHIKG